MRPIDADELFGMESILATAAHGSESRFLMEQVLYDIQHVPTIDIAPVVHARWGNDTDNGYTPCTNCGWKHPILDQNLRAVADAYCPYCGAKMDAKG